ncbi:type IV secretion system protein VirB10 [Phenylobacterium sp.]|uniref:type IV secretion system protein VirB10 n=1 Tax=Phenylobacterium sp. TaxID=1871053 RepID=UPI003569818B
MTDTPPPAAPEQIADRGISPIAGRLTNGRTGKVLVLAALVAGCGAFALATSRPHPRAAEKAPDTPAKQVVPYEAAPTLAHPGADAPTLGATPAATPAAAPTASSGPAAANPLQAIRGAPLLAYGAGGGATTLPAAPSLASLVAASADRPAPTELDQLRRGSVIGQARARRLGDRSFLILAGASLPCILQTAMDTSTPGYVSCVIPQDVYSDNGAVVLLEKGTKVLGEYRSSLKAGQARLFVLWTRAVTPNGVALDLASSASDALGRAGFDGEIDRHFWERFGGAMLLSIVDDGAAAVAPKTGSLETLRAPSDAAGIALQHGIDLPPTLRKAQGSEVAIFAAQDFDFSSVYGLKAR